MCGKGTCRGFPETLAVIASTGKKCDPRKGTEKMKKVWMWWHRSRRLPSIHQSSTCQCRDSAHHLMLKRNHRVTSRDWKTPCNAKGHRGSCPQVVLKSRRGQEPQCSPPGAVEDQRLIQIHASRAPCTGTERSTRLLRFSHLRAARGRSRMLPRSLGD